MMFADFDRSLRELGVGDLSVGRKIKRMATAFYGRIVAYERGLAADDTAARRRLWRATSTARRRRAAADLATLAAYLRDAAARPSPAQPIDDLIGGHRAFRRRPRRPERRRNDATIGRRPSSRASFRSRGWAITRPHTAITANEAERAALARRFDLVVARPLRRRCPDRPRHGRRRSCCEAAIEADIVQDCVVTLEPVRQPNRRSISRCVYRRRVAPPSELLDVDEDDVRAARRRRDRYRRGGRTGVFAGARPFPRAPGAAIVLKP